MGELKELDKNLITKTNTLNGMVLDPHAVLNSIAPARQTQQQPYIQQPPVVQQPELTINTPPPQEVVPENDVNQLEFNFNNNPYTVQVFDRIESIERKIETILKLQTEILSSLQNKKEGS